MKTAGQRAYEAHAMYRAAHPPSLQYGWTAPPWNELTDDTKTAWERAAEAARDDGAPSENPPHPMQPVVMGHNGRERFKMNHIICWLFESGRMSLNDTAALPVPVEDHMQLAQLLGYSIQGYGELSYVTDESYDAAVVAAEKLKRKT